MKRFIAAFLVLLLLFGGTPSVSAMSSPPTYWEGIRQAGVYLPDSDCSIEVEHMLLTFDLQNFANPTTSSEEELLAYTGKVTTQYTFYNPTDNTITTTLLFLLGYYDDPLFDLNADKYDIWIDGNPVEKTLCNNQFNPSNKFPYVHYDTTQWYAYEITLEPGQRIVNTITAPIYPSVHTNYDPQVYEYYYHPVPDFTWNNFGTLDVVINTPFHLFSITEEYEKTDTGYKASFDEAASGSGYMCFQLCTSENPEEIDTGSDFTWVLIIAWICSLFVRAFNAIGEFFTNIFQFLF